jgi:hypothetical protein
MLVWQDMPQCFGPRDAKDAAGGLTAAVRSQWLAEWFRIISERGNHPSIIVWTTFNEGWGQHETDEIVAITKRWDPTRLVNNASGWNDKNCGDIRDTHAYPGPWCEIGDGNRAVVNGEFGGITMRVPDHQWGGKLFGYGSTLKSGWKVTDKYQKLLKTAYQLRDDRGASAFVYTQLTDVEGESNGLLTYDRAVTKPLAEFITFANTGKFPPLPPARPEDLSSARRAAAKNFLSHRLFDPRPQRFQLVPPAVPHAVDEKRRRAVDPAADAARQVFLDSG